MQIAEFPVSCDPERGFMLDVEEVKIRFTARTTCKRDLLRTFAPCELVDPILKIRQKVFCRFGDAVVEKKAEFVTFVAGAELAAPGKVFSVGRIGGVEVAAWGCADFDRLR